MAGRGRGLSVPVVVALISGAVAITTTVITQWDKLFPPVADRGLPAANDVGALDVPGTDKAVQGLGQAQASKIGDLAELIGSLPGRPPGVTGDWLDQDGRSFAFTQAGSAIDYVIASRDGQGGTGTGTLDGYKLTYDVDRSGRSYDCVGELALNSEKIVATCRAAGASFTHSLIRSRPDDRTAGG